MMKEKKKYEKMSESEERRQKQNEINRKKIFQDKIEKFE